MFDCLVVSLVTFTLHCTLANGTRQRLFVTIYNGMVGNLIHSLAM